MRAMRAVEFAAKRNNVIRFVQKNRQPVLILKDGTPHCMLLPVGKVESLMFRALYRRTANKRRKPHVRP